MIDLRQHALLYALLLFLIVYVILVAAAGHT